MRLDLFLKTSRLVKRRAVAKEMCEAGRVLVNGREAGPAKEVRQGDRIMIKYAAKHLEIEVIGFPARKAGAVAEEMYRMTAETRVERTDEAW